MNQTLGLISAPEFCDRLDLSYRIIDYWDRENVLVPTRPAEGSGTQRGYSDLDVAIGRVLARLRTMGCGTRVLRTVAEQLRDLPLPDWPAVIAVDPRGRISHPQTVCCGSWVVPTRTDCFT